MLMLELPRGAIRGGITAFVPVKKHEAGDSAARSAQAEPKPNLIVVPASQGQREQQTRQSSQGALLLMNSCGGMYVIK